MCLYVCHLLRCVKIKTQIGTVSVTWISRSNDTAYTRRRTGHDMVLDTQLTRRNSIDTEKDKYEINYVEVLRYSTDKSNYPSGSFKSFEYRIILQANRFQKLHVLVKLSVSKCVWFIPAESSLKQKYLINKIYVCFIFLDLIIYFFFDYRYFFHCNSFYFSHVRFFFLLISYSQQQ